MKKELIEAIYKETFMSALTSNRFVYLICGKYKLIKCSYDYPHGVVRKDIYEPTIYEELGVKGIYFSMLHVKPLSTMLSYKDLKPFLSQEELEQVNHYLEWLYEKDRFILFNISDELARFIERQFPDAVDKAQEKVFETIYEEYTKTEEYAKQIQFLHETLDSFICDEQAVIEMILKSLELRSKLHFTISANDAKVIAEKIKDAL